MTEWMLFLDWLNAMFNWLVELAKSYVVDDIESMMTDLLDLADKSSEGW